MGNVKIKLMFIATLLFTTFNACAQGGSVFMFLFRIDPELTNYEKVEFHRTWFSGYSEGEAMPNELIDSIKLKTEEAFSSILKMPVKMCFKKNAADEIFTTAGTFGWLEGLPANTLKKAQSICPQQSRYIKLDVNIYASGGSSITLANTKTKLKPKIQLYAKVFDEKGDVVWKKDLSLNDFSNLRSVTNYYKGYDITKSEVLSPLDIYAMYRKALDKLTSE